MLTLPFAIPVDVVRVRARKYSPIALGRVSIYLALYEIIGIQALNWQTNSINSKRNKGTAQQKNATDKNTESSRRFANKPEQNASEEESQTFDADERRGNRLFAIDDVKPFHNAWRRPMQ